MSPHEATALHVLAYALLHNAQATKAAALLEAVDALRPDEVRTLMTLAAAHLRSGAAARALQVLARLESHAAPPAAAALLKAQALARLGRQTEARTSMQAYLAQRASPPQSAANRG